MFSIRNSDTLTKSRNSKVLCNPKFHYLNHNSLPNVLIVSQMNPVQAIFPCLFKKPISILSSYLRLSLPSSFTASFLPLRTFCAFTFKHVNEGVKLR